MSNSITTIVFDLGGVLVDWNTKYVYDESYFKSEADREYFFNNICTFDWNEQQDAGKNIALATQELVVKYPEWEAAIRDYYGRWTDMLGGPISGTVEIFRKILTLKKYKIYALTNWQASLFEIALARYNFLHWFDGRVVSGEEKTRKPFEDFFNIMLTRYSFSPGEAIFIDDNLRNIEAAVKMGFECIQFSSPEALEAALINRGIL